MVAPRTVASLCGAAALALLASAWPAAAHAAPPTGAPAAGTGQDDDETPAIPARFVMGVKFGAGGTLWTEPDNVPKESDGQSVLPIFDQTRAGYTMAAGMFAEGIFFDHLGLEVGLHFVEHTLLEKVTWTFTDVEGSSVLEQSAKSKEQMQWTAVHVPILVKAVVPSGQTRISLGVGPEFAFASWAKTKFQIAQSDAKDGDTLVLPGSRGVFKTLNAKLEDSVYLSVVFGIEITVGDFLIPIDIHWAYDLTQGSDYSDRASIDPAGSTSPSSLTLKTRDSMYGDIRVGIAYQF